VINEILSKIDMNRIRQSIGTIRIYRPSVVPSEILPLRLSVVQLTCEGDSYVISKLYVNINEQTEVALNADYSFDVLNSYEEGDEYYISGYGAFGEKRTEYFINRDVLAIGPDMTYMKKVGGEYYYTPETHFNDPVHEALRSRLFETERMLCHTVKPDGRACMYVTVDADLEHVVSTIWREANE